MNTKQQVLHLYRHEFQSFVGLAFRLTHPSIEYQHNWHLEVLADQLQKVWCGDETRLIINMPPGSLQSFCVSTAFMPWYMAKSPGKRVLHISGTSGEKRRVEESCRTLFRHEKFLGVFPQARLCHDKKNLTLSQGATGHGVVSFLSDLGEGLADLIILDDPLAPTKIKNLEALRRLPDWVKSSVMPCLKGPKSAIIIVTQRHNVDDLTSELLKTRENWTVLNIAAISTKDEKWVLADGTTFNRQAFQPLHPERQSLEALREIAHDIGAFSFRAQYLQAPIYNRNFPNEDGNGSIWVPQNKNPKKPSGFFRVFPLETLDYEVFRIGECPYHVHPHELLTAEDWEAEAIISQAKLIAETQGRPLDTC